MHTLGDRIELYIGAPIEHESERSALTRVIESLQAEGLSAVVIANVHLSGRQIDLIVAIDSFSLVVEAKLATRPLRGGENGHWEFYAATGDWKSAGRNYYQQALSAAHAVRDAMCAFSGKSETYPHAALVFVRALPIGSQLFRGDFKVNVGGPTLLEHWSSYEKRGTWSLAQWRSFCATHQLIRLHSLGAALDARVAAAEGLLAEYARSFASDRGVVALNVVPFQCRRSDGELAASGQIAELTTPRGLLIVGPSGCGKTLLVHQIGLQQAACGHVPVLIEGKHFERAFGKLLNEELTLLGAPSFGAVLAAAGTCGRPLTLILDAFNECSPALRTHLVRCLRAMAFRYRVGLVVTAQEVFPELKQLGLELVEVLEPDLSTKRAIANLPQSTTEAVRVEELLAAARSGVEAHIIGQVGASVSIGISRYALFDAYIRVRMADGAADAISILARVGAWLTDHVSFSMSLRDFDRLADVCQWPPGASRRLVAAKLLHLRGDRISFGHELYFNAFSAEAVVRKCGNDAGQLLAALAAPKHANYKALALGAIDNTTVMHSVLEGLKDPDLLVACVSGECSEYARDWACDRCEEVLRAIENECQSVKFRIDEGAWMNIAAEPDSLHQWSDQERAFLVALSRLLARGSYLDDIFRIVGVMGTRLDDSYASLRQELGPKKIALRSALFAVGLDHQNSDIAISRIIARADLHHVMNSETDAAGIGTWAERKLRDAPLSNGQLLMILKLLRHSSKRKFPSALLPEFIRDRWRGAPHHLLLALLDAAQYAWDATEEEKARIVEAINEIEVRNVWISTSVVEALKGLGAIQDSEHYEVARSELRQVLSDVENPETWPFAQNLYTRQFDHPYDGVYWEVIHELPDDQRKEFLRCAVRDKNQYRMFTSCMISDLAKFRDRETGACIALWADLPPADHPMMQDAIEVFVVSHVALGLLQYPMTTKVYSGSNDDNALMACGELYYWINRHDLSQSERVANSAPAWKVLSRHELGVSLAALEEFEGTSRGGMGRVLRAEDAKCSIIESFPEEVAEIGRHAVRDGVPQQCRHPWTRQEELICFAIAILGVCGKRTDLTLLRGLAEHPVLGTAALAAVKILEERLV